MQSYCINRNNKHIIDILNSVDKVNIEAIFEPEHGIWGMDDKRAKLIGSKRVDPVSGARVFNLLKGVYILGLDNEKT